MTKTELKSLRYIKLRVRQMGEDEEEDRVRLENKIARIEAWIDNIDDVIVHDVIVYRFVRGWKWAKVAVTLGGDNTEDGVRKIVERYLRREKSGNR